MEQESLEWPAVETEFSLVVRQLEGERDDDKENWDWIVSDEDEDYLAAGATPSEAIHEFADWIEGDTYSGRTLDPEDLVTDEDEE